MIRGRGESVDGKPIFLLGLTEENERRLLGDEPILVNLGQLGGPDVNVVIFYAGKTEVDALMDLGAAFSIDEVVIDPDLIPGEAPEGK